MRDRISASEARRRLGEVLDRVRLHGDHITIERRGVPVAVCVPVEAAETLERMSRDYLLHLLRKGPRRTISERTAGALANEAKHRSRLRR